MRKTFCAMCMASMFGIGAGVSAQYDSKAKDQMGKKDMMKDGQVAVSGCVAAGTESGKYMLNNAMMMTHDMSGKDHMAKDQVAKPAMAGDHSKPVMTGDHSQPVMAGDHSQPVMAGDHSMMSYELVGGDLKAHVGHKVEVTGNLSKSDMDHMAKMDKMEKDKMMADKNMKAMKLNVKSLKMVSASCM